MAKIASDQWLARARFQWGFLDPPGNPGFWPSDGAGLPRSGVARTVDQGRSGRAVIPKGGEDPRRGSQHRAGLSGDPRCGRRRAEVCTPGGLLARLHTAEAVVALLWRAWAGSADLPEVRGMAAGPFTLWRRKRMRRARTKHGSYSAETLRLIRAVRALQWNARRMLGDPLSEGRRTVRATPRPAGNGSKGCGMANTGDLAQATISCQATHA